MLQYNTKTKKFSTFANSSEVSSVSNGSTKSCGAYKAFVVVSYAPKPHRIDAKREPSGSGFVSIIGQKIKLTRAANPWMFGIKVVFRRLIVVPSAFWTIWEATTNLKNVKVKKIQDN